MNESEITAYVERSQSLIDQAPQMDEENTKVKLIQPLIELLGWDMFSSEVELEYPMQIGRGNTRADYALLIETAPVVFIEAKGCDSTLTDADRSQLTSYMRQKGVDWGLLTTGSQFEVFRRRKNSSRPDEVSLAQFSIAELEDNWHVLELLSKELVKTGEADTIAHRIEARQHAVETLQQQKESLAERVTQLVIAEIDDSLAQEIEPNSKEYIDSLIHTLENGDEVDLPVVENGGEIVTTSDEVVADTSSTVETEFFVHLSANGDRVWSCSDENQSDAMAETVDLLIQEYDLIDQFESFPYVPGSKNAILNSEPTHPTGEPMRMQRDLSDDYYLYVALDQGSKKRYITRFSELCGLTAEFDGGW